MIIVVVVVVAVVVVVVVVGVMSYAPEKNKQSRRPDAMSSTSIAEAEGWPNGCCFQVECYICLTNNDKAHIIVYISCRRAFVSTLCTAAVYFTT